MDDADRVYRDALTEYHRRVLRIGTPGYVAGWPLVVWWRGREAWARRDYLTLGGIGLSITSVALNHTVNYRRAERRADEDLIKEARRRELARRNAEQAEATGQGIAAPLVPTDQSTVGCMAPMGLTVAGFVQAIWDYYRHRPDRHRHRARPRWQWRPGPTWWTAWSWQQLPVHATSTAPHAHQVAYERRQLITLRATGGAASAITTWENQLKPALANQEWLRLAAGLLKISTAVVNGVAEYRRVPDKVDAQRARRRRHDAAVADLARAHAAGRPGPANPWRVDMAVTAVGAATIVTSFALQLRQFRHRPRPPTPQPPRPPVRKRPPLAA